MSSASTRLSKLAAQLFPSKSVEHEPHQYNIHTLSPTSFLPRAAVVEPNVGIPYDEPRIRPLIDLYTYVG